MSELIQKLRHEADNQHDAEAIKLLLWAALHIESQDAALAEAREEWEPSAPRKAKA